MCHWPLSLVQAPALYLGLQRVSPRWTWPTCGDHGVGAGSPIQLLKKVSHETGDGGVTSSLAGSMKMEQEYRESHGASLSSYLYPPSIVRG